MYQFFVDEPIQVGCDIILSKDQTHHAKDVLRLHNEMVRIVSDGKGYFGEIYIQDKEAHVRIDKEDIYNNELDIDITIGIALIRKEKMELAIQKATELGAKKIVPLVTKNCVVKSIDKHKERILQRYQTIATEASAQCKRNIIPTITEPLSIADADTIMSKFNYVAHNEATSPLSKRKETKTSVTILIGPEGGFDESEIEVLVKDGYETVSFGRRVFRAETAVMYACTVLSTFGEEDEVLVM